MGEDNFIVTVEVVVDKAFFGWLTSMGRNVHILKPKKAAVAYRDYLKNIAKIIRELINKYDIRKDRIMKRRATAILLGIMVSSMFLSACGKNEAKEAANESAQVEEEGVGEVTEEGEKVEAENKNASDADDSSKAGDSAKSDEDNKETSVKEEEDGDSSGKDSDDESEEDAEVTEASAGKIGVLLSDDDEDAKIDSEEMTSQIEDGGYEADVKNAGGDPALQISQIQEFIDEKVSALIIDPVDSYGLTDILKTAKEQEIPVISYDSLIRDTADINYYVTYDTRAIGKDIAKEIIKKMDLDKAREDKKSYTIEFLMGSPDDNAALFLCNGIQEGLQEYLDDGTLVCKSGNTSLDDTGIMRWSETSAKTKLDSIISEFYAEEKAPDIICTAYDGFAYAAEEILSDSGLEPGSDEWPMITGYGSEAQAVKDIAAGKMSFTMFMDRKELAKGGAQMAIDYLTGEKVDVKDYSQYDNGVKIVGTFTCGAQMIDKDNYQILVDNGTYTEDEIAPDPTPTPEVTPAPEATPVPKVTLKTASEEDSKEVTPTPETEDKSEGETRENLIYDSEDNSKVEKTSDQKK